MEKTKQKVSELCEMKETLMCCARDELSKGIQQVNTHEMGEVVDMIKDLCEAEEKCWKAKYYESIVEAMKEEKEMEEMMAKMGQGGEGRMGYDNWRYSSGRFAPTGHGHRSGYRPGEQIDDPGMMAEGFDHQNMGYSGNSGRGGSGDGRSSQGSSMSSGNGGMGDNGRMGYTGPERGHRYDQYLKARMGYHESKDAAHKEHMDASARDYVLDIADSVEEIWRDADPAMRKEIQNKFVALTGKMN